MAIHEEEIAVVGGGFKKEIEASSMSMMMDNLQKTQYQFPVESTIRELTSNAIDSTKEKFDALRILHGEITVEELYVEREGTVYEDSKFNREYYDEKHLSDEKSVTIEFINRPDQQRDLLRIIDQGVGLGGKRIRKVFNLGFSSKRLSKGQLGKFGLGSKVALSTGVRFYTLISNYNGRQYVFNAYDEHFESLTPRFDFETKAENPYEDWENGTDTQGNPRFERVYYRTTEELNGVTVEVEVKKIFKQRYLDAVRNQLTYFDNIKCFDVHDTYREEIKVVSAIVHEDDIMVLSDNKRFDKPHVVINRVNYGFVNWEELELTDKRGNIGIKLTAEEAEISPNREHIIWNERTRDAILEAFRKVQAKADAMLNEGIKHLTCPFEWLLARGELTGRTNNNTVMGRLAGIVDVDFHSMKFKGKSITQLDVIGEFSPISLEKIYYDQVYKDGEYKLEKKTIPFSKWTDFYKELGVYYQNTPDIIVQKDNTSAVKDKYLFNSTNRPFFKIRVTTSVEGVNIDRLSDTNKEIIQGIKKRSNFIKYEDIDVPKNFVFADEEKEREAQKKKEEKEAERLKEIAARKEKISVQLWSGSYSYTQDCYPSDIQVEFSDDAIYYGNSDSDPLLSLAEKILRNSYNELVAKNSPWTIGTNAFRSHYVREYGNGEFTDSAAEAQFVKDFVTTHHPKPFVYNSLPEKLKALIAPTHILRVSRKNDAKKLKNYRPIEQFFHQFHPETGTMTVAMELQQAYTGNLIENSPILRHIRTINDSGRNVFTNYPLVGQLFKEAYELYKFKERYSSLYSSSGTVRDAIVGHCEKLADLQTLVQDGGTPDEISAMAKSLFSMPDETADKVKSAQVYDSEVVKRLRNLEDVFTVLPILSILNYKSTDEAGWLQLEQLLVTNNISF